MTKPDKRRKAQKQPRKGDLCAAFLKAAGDYMLVETPLAVADVCLLFGNARADDIANHAADLYAQGYFKRAVVSGGVPTDDGRLEAHRMRDVLIERGVPASAILVEDKATNTGENVMNTMELLKKSGELDAIKSVLGIGRMYAGRRFLMTLEKHWPQTIKMFSAPDHYGVPRDKFHLDQSFRTAVLREYRKIDPYKEKGFIADIDLDAMAKKIATLPKPTPTASRKKPPASAAPRRKMRHRSENRGFN
jgi:hypothetical protein